MKKYQPILIIGGFIVVLLFAVGAGCPQSTPDKETNSSPPDPSTNLMVKNQIIVRDQTPENNTVTIETVLATKNGWVAVHADNNGELGNLLGYAKVSAGINDNVSVNIDQTKVTAALYVRLYVDAGVENQFEIEGDDAPATLENGDIITKTFGLTIQNEENAANEPADQPQTTETATSSDQSKKPDDQPKQSDPAETVSQTVDKTYRIDDSSTVSYIVQKKWLGKPTEPVTGTNNDVSGSFVYNESQKILKNINVSINSQTFRTDSGGRDGVVRGLLGTSAIVVKSTGSVTNVGPGAVNKTIPLELTLNNVTKTVNFIVNGIINEVRGNATGSAGITMTDFNIEPPSLLGVYTVDSQLIISLNITSQ